jgi:hypothetical protein
VTLKIEGSNGFVTSTAASTATGWNEPAPGWDLHPLWTKRPSRRTRTISLADFTPTTVSGRKFSLCHRFNDPDHETEHRAGRGGNFCPAFASQSRWLTSARRIAFFLTVTKVIGVHAGRWLLSCGAVSVRPYTPELGRLPGTGPLDARRNRVTHHFCPTCEQRYSCPRGEEDCGSPQVYDCYYCYVHRHRKELSALLASVTTRFGHNQSCASMAISASCINARPRGL